MIAWRYLGFLAVAGAVAMGFAAGARGGHAEAQPGSSTEARAPELSSDGPCDQILEETGFLGGLAVLVQPRDASLMVALARRPDTLVHGLVQQADQLAAIRAAIRAAGLYGQASAMAWQGTALPYAEGTVNLLVQQDDGVALSPAEIERVLAPQGIAVTSREGALLLQRKPRPADVDEWTHGRYDATGNAVSKDQRTGPPTSLQWEAGPRWNHGVKTSGLVSAQGRIFYILDDSPFTSNTRTWSLIARDAYNGVQLWRHQLPSWGGARGGKKVGPVQMHRRLVAVGDRVYATLGEFAPVSVLDAASGELVRTLPDTEPAAEFVLSDGVLVALVDPRSDASVRRGGERWLRLVAVDAESGQQLWKHEAATILPMTLAADGEQVVFHDGKVLNCLDLRSGAHRWSSPPTGQKIVARSEAHPDSPGAEPSTIILAPQFAPTLILYEDVVAFAGGRQLVVVSSRDGSELWRSAYAPSNYSVPVDLFGFDGCVWGPDAKMNLWRPLDDNLDMNAYDPHSGSITKTVQGNYGFRFQHHRCHPMKVVAGTVIAARAGIEFLDTETGELAAHHWTRGSCYFGVLPANGLLYVPPHDCACYVRAKLSGFMALRSAPPAQSAGIADDERLIRGPAFGCTLGAADDARPDDWPTYRSDMARSGRARVALSPQLAHAWQAQLGGRLTSPVIAGGRVFLASTDEHTLLAADAVNGERLWQVSLDARIDSPPTIHQGLVICGCRDGSVHAFRAADGVLAWRFRASPDERLIVSRGQLESAWPVSGSVLVVDGIVYFAAGKSSYLDGGIRLYGLEAHAGRKVVDRVLSKRLADGSQTIDEQGVDGWLNDVLSSDGQRLFMRHQAFDLAGNPLAERVPHLHSPDGYLSGDTTARLLWTRAPIFTSVHQGAFYDERLSRMLFPAGRILVEDDEIVFGYGQNHYQQLQAEPGGQWALFAAEKESTAPLDLSAIEYRKRALAGEVGVRFRWWKPLPIQVRAMVRTEEVLFVAGPAAAVAADTPEDKPAARLLAVSPSDGRVLADLPLAEAPVWDGLAAARDRLYLALADGQLLCLSPAAKGNR